MSADKPPELIDFNPAKFEGHWSIVVSNYGYWKNRTNASVTYERLPGERVTWRDTLKYGQKSLWGSDFRPSQLGGIDVQDAQVKSHFVWRGDGILRLIKSPWWVVLVGQEYDWAVTYFGRSNVGTAPGIDLYFRRPDPEPELVAQIVDQAKAHPFLGPRSQGFFQTAQDGISPNRYHLR